METNEKKLGYLKQTGLGKNNQGIKEPINLPIKLDKNGISFNKDFLIGTIENSPLTHEDPIKGIDDYPIG